MTEIDHGPAVTCRCKGHKNPDFDYPARFKDRVPKTVKVTRGFLSNVFVSISKGRDLIAKSGAEYPAWTNSHGAVAAILPCGERLGLCPHEFEVVEWLEPAREQWVLDNLPKDESQ